MLNPWAALAGGADNPFVEWGWGAWHRSMDKKRSGGSFYRGKGLGAVEGGFDLFCVLNMMISAIE